MMKVCKKSDDDIVEWEINARSLKPRRLKYKTQGIRAENEVNHAKRKSTENTSIGMFQQMCKAKIENKAKTVNNRVKISKYFGVNSKEEKRPNTLVLDGLLRNLVNI
eukprot:875425_1